MSRVVLHQIAMKRESKSFTDSLYAVLTAADLFCGPKFMLSGLSGMAFKFTVHERLLPLSVTAYGQWGIEHRPAVDNLGVFTESDAGRTRHPTFPYYQKQAVKWIKQPLDRGVGVIYWIPEFGVIHGYDDEDRVFFLQDGQSAESQIVLYDNFGLNFTPFWYCRVFGDKVAVDPVEMALESLRLAIHDWETPHKTLPNTNIASGRRAYTFLIRGLELGNYHEHGAVYILDSYCYSRLEIVNYLREVHGLLLGLSDALQIYVDLERLIPQIKSYILVTNGVRQVERSRIGELVKLLSSAKEIEEQAMFHFCSISAQYPDLRRTIVPRWGSHMPR